MIRNGVLLGALMAAIAIFSAGVGTSPYPFAGTALFALAAAFETVVLFVVLRPRSYQHSWGRALVASLLCLVTLWFSAQDTVGAPEYVFMHQRWLFVATLGCLVLAISSAVVRVRRRRVP
jgi:hypothetical protein